MMTQGPQQADTWPKLLRLNSQKYGSQQTAMRYKHYGIWRPYTWTDYYHQVKTLASGLLSLAFKPEDKVLIIGDAAPQFYFAELATQANKGITVGLYAESSPEEIKRVAANTGARFAIVEDQEQVDKFMQIKDDLPALEKVVFWNYKGLHNYSEPILLAYNLLLEKGEAYESEHPTQFEENITSGSAGDVCSIVYTAGTTGEFPKGVVHTYQTMQQGAEYYLKLDAWRQNDNMVPYLPPVWMPEKWFNIGCHLQSACMINFPEKPETQERDTRETNPSILIYGARVWENQAASVQARILESDALKRFVFKKLMPVGYKMVDIRQNGQKPGIGLKMSNALANLVLFRQIKKSLGFSNARICYTSGSTLSADAYRFYHAIGLRLKNLYWTTEGGAISGAPGDDIDLDTVGPPHDGVSVKTTESGELVYQQPGAFIGYYNDPQATEAVFRDGWFYSGDRVEIRQDNQIVFKDQLQDLLTLASNSQIEPQGIESQLRFSPYIKDAWITAQPDKDYLAAIIIINYRNVSQWAGQNRVHHTAFEDLSQKPEVYDLIRNDIDRINHNLPAGVKISKYALLTREFDPDKDEMTRSRKLRKSRLKVLYQPLIEAVFSDEAEAPVTASAPGKSGQVTTIHKTVQIKHI